MAAAGERKHLRDAVDAKSSSSSFGMAKLFVTSPKHHFNQLKTTVERVESSLLLAKQQQLSDDKPHRKRQRPGNPLSTEGERDRFEVERIARLKHFRTSQSANPLPIDQIESEIPWDAPVTILKGGTGSGKTTRYPLMLSLLAPSESSQSSSSAEAMIPKILVSQPRRLACQTAARHVASQILQTNIGDDTNNTCPIGYLIRFESMPAKGSRTIDYCTPGVLLRRATEDPLLSDVTHLIIDEVHVRNADTDLLLSLAKQAMIQRRNQTDSLPPLKVVLMSATLESARWEDYFGGDVCSNHDDIAVINVPDYRRFPIDIVHRGDKGFPKLRSATTTNQQQRSTSSSFLNNDDALCQMTAELAFKLVRQEQEKQTKKQRQKGSSILCFLPGMEEIQLVDRHLREEEKLSKQGGGGLRGRKLQPPFRVQYLHSSLSSKQQSQVFEEGLKIILSTNIAETSLTIPDVKAVIDTGRERQHSLLESASASASDNNNSNDNDDSSFRTVVGSQLATVNISQANAQQRAGRAGRVSAGTCYRLYTQEEYETVLEPRTKPEMQRMELSQLILHSLSLYHPTSATASASAALEHHHHDPLQLLKDAPDPPDPTRLQQTLRGLAAQGLIVNHDRGRNHYVELTPLGKAVSSIPASPLLGRMLMMGLLLQSIEPAIAVASLLSIPKVFGGGREDDGNSPNSQHSSDVIKCLANYLHYCNLTTKQQKDHPEQRVECQLEDHMRDFLAARAAVQPSKDDVDNNNNDNWDEWNTNSDRVGAIVSLLCCATPHIAHLVQGKNGFATRDIPGYARMHPSSVNFDKSRRVHWYVYNELRTTKSPYLHVTTAVSPLEVAMFSEASANIIPPTRETTNAGGDDNDTQGGDDKDEWDYGTTPAAPTISIDNATKEWLFVIDQWIPVAVTNPSQRETFVKLRNLLMHDLPQQITLNPSAFVAADSDAKELVLLVLSAIEQYRIEK